MHLVIHFFMNFIGNLIIQILFQVSGQLLTGLDSGSIAHFRFHPAKHPLGG